MNASRMAVLVLVVVSAVTAMVANAVEIKRGQEAAGQQSPARAATDASSPRQLERLVFLSHPYAWELQAARDLQRGRTVRSREVIAMERRVSSRWPEEIRKLGPKDFLIINYFGGRPADAELQAEPVASLLRAAKEHMGDRYLLLFGTAAKNKVGEEIRRQIRAEGYTYEPAAVATESWGQSTEGCVVNFGAHFAAGMGLPKGFPMRYELTFPDAPFAMKGKFLECVALGDSDVRLYLSTDDQGQPFGIFFPGVLRDGQSSRSVEFSGDPAVLEFTHKNGEPVAMPRTDGRFRVPLYVDNYGKPVYIWGKKLGIAEFKAILAAARVIP